MQKVRQLVEEIRELREEVNHRAALRICAILENNRRLFLEKMDADDFTYLLRLFQEIADTPARDFGTDYYKDNYRRSFGLLLFHLDKII